MPIIVRRKKTNFFPAPEGLHPAVCVDVIDLGIQPTPWGEKPQVRLIFQLSLVNEHTQERHRAVKTYNRSLEEKATLLKDLQSWRGKKLTEEELEEFELESVIGCNCQIQIVHKERDDGRVVANVETIVPLGKDMPRLQAENYTRTIEQQNNKKEPEQNDDNAEF